MKLTVENIYNFPELKGIHLVAGSSGLNREVAACGILDYELDKSVSDKYYDYNYRQANFITLTSFLYAKDNEYLILDAVKKLSAKGGSGLIIRNVFNLPINESVIKYADYMKFPIFILEGVDIFFEDLIILISKRAEHYSSLDYRADKVEKLLSGKHDKNQKLHIAEEINISIKNDSIAAYFLPYKPLEVNEYLKYEKLFFDSGILNASDSLFYYKQAMMLIHSKEIFASSSVDAIIAPYIQVLGESVHDFKIGVSKVHHFLSDLDESFYQAIGAAHLQFEKDKPYQPFDDIGIYQILFPYAKDKIFSEYSKKYVSVLKDYDVENNGNFLDTAIQFVICDGNIETTGKKMNQHKNTIRYRLDKISKLIGINILTIGNYEKFSIAIKVFLCQQFE